MTADGSFLIDADGNRVLLDDGSRDTCESCCGFTPGVDCEYCTGDTPEYIVATWSGFDTCPCTSLTAGGSRLVTLAPELDGKVLLKQLDGFPCRWYTTNHYSTIAPYEWETYASSDCSGSPSGAGGTPFLDATLLRTSSTTLAPHFYGITYVEVGPQYSDQDSHTIATDCDEATTLTNGLDSGDCDTVGGGFWAALYGGSIVLTPGTGGITLIAVDDGDMPSTVTLSGWDEDLSACVGGTAAPNNDTQWNGVLTHSSGGRFGYTPPSGTSVQWGNNWIDGNVVLHPAYELDGTRKWALCSVSGTRVLWWGTLAWDAEDPTGNYTRRGGCDTTASLTVS